MNTIDENLNDGANISNEQEEADLDTANEESSYEQDESVDWKSKAEKAEELANNYKIRAEKAEKLAKTVKSEPVKKQDSQTAGNLNQKDFLYVAKADIHEDDIDEVLNYASKNGISVKEAHEYLKPILNVHAEQRMTASAANVGSAKRSSSKTPDDVILSKAAKGELPENDADLERLIKLRKGIK
jgi:predicted XRE-type DNA-binding protein